MQWTRRRTVLNGETIPDDWIVHLDGVPVGRIYFAIQLTAPRRWWWGSWAQPCRSGTDETLDAALESLRTCVLASSGTLTDNTKLW
jgi:hypothetical protein